MYPVLFRSGSVTVYAYGFFVTLGLIAAAVLVILKGRGRGLGITFEYAADLFFYTVLSGIVGSRLLFVLLHFNSFRTDPVRIFKIWEGGLVFYGGLLLAAAVSVCYLRWRRLPVRKLVDLVSPPIALGLSFGRVGCFLAGCCYGKETSLPWGVIFTNRNSLAPLNACLHPTQLYEALTCLGIFFLLNWLEKRKTFDGEVFGALLILYSVTRFFIEMLRGDPRGFLFTDALSTSQGIGICLAICSVFMLFYLKCKHGRQGRWLC